jgi:ParB family chromosome partitioning protein
MSVIDPSKKAETRPTRKGGLGKGFNSLLGLHADAVPEKTSDLQVQSPTSQISPSGITQLDINLLEPNPHQPRKLFDDEALRSLAESIKQDGIIQPLLVSHGKQGGKYTLIAGERRWRAARLAGLNKVPVVIKEHAEEEMLRVALIENIQRQDLNIIEEALAYSSLIEEFGLTQEQCSKKVGKDRSTVANALRLLSLPREIHEDLMEHRLTMGHGRALLALGDSKKILRARDIVIKKQLSVRQTERLCKNLEAKDASKAQPKGTEQANLNYVAESLRSHLRTKVKLNGTNSRGKIEISYFSGQELERILATIGVKIQ